MDKHSYIKEKIRERENSANMAQSLINAHAEYEQAYAVFDVSWRRNKHISICSGYETQDNILAHSEDERTSKLLYILSDTQCRKVLVEIINNFHEIMIDNDKAEEISKRCDVESEEVTKYINSFKELGIMFYDCNVDGKVGVKLEDTVTSGYALLMAGIIRLRSHTVHK